MKAQIYTVFDTQAEASIKPLFFENDNIAIRSFKASVTAADNPMASNPQDFVLYSIGSWDDEEMIIVGHEPKRIMSGFEAVRDRAVDVDRLQALEKEIEAIKSGNGTGKYPELET